MLKVAGLEEGGKPVCWKLIPGLAEKALNSVTTLREPGCEEDGEEVDVEEPPNAVPPDGLGKGTYGLYDEVALLVCKYLSLRREPATRLMLGLAVARSGAVAQTWMLCRDSSVSR